MTMRSPRRAPASVPDDARQRIVFVTPYPPSHQHPRSLAFLAEMARAGRYLITLLTLCRTPGDIAATFQLRRLGIEVCPLPDDTPASADGAAYDAAPQLRSVLHQVILRGDVALVHIEGERLAPITRDLSVPVVWDVANSDGIIRRLTARGPQIISDLYEVELLSSCASVIVSDEQAAIALLAIRRRTARGAMRLLPPLRPTPQSSSLPMSTAHDDRLRSASSIRLVHEAPRDSHDPQVCVIPNGVEVDNERSWMKSSSQAGRALQHRSGLLIAGDFSDEGWVSSVSWFLGAVAPRLWRIHPELPITLAPNSAGGITLPLRASIRAAQREHGERIRLIEDPMDIRRLAQRAELAVVPLVGGADAAGIASGQASALSTMAQGLPTIVMQPVLAKMLAAPGRDLLVATSGDRLITLILRALGDKELWGLLARNGRMYVERRHSWRQSASQLEALYARLLMRAQPINVPAPGGVSADTLDDEGV
ncbi:MAG TPA: glycosyltransferase, partial [Ktedonobacterales bacterium]|nr:glycosyltransferase [Ktedonobacterales bacterium]